MRDAWRVRHLDVLQGGTRKEGFCKNVFVNGYIQGVQNKDKLPNLQYVKWSIPILISHSSFKVVFVLKCTAMEKETISCT